MRISDKMSRESEIIPYPSDLINQFRILISNRGLSNLEIRPCSFKLLVIFSKFQPFFLAIFLPFFLLRCTLKLLYRKQSMGTNILLVIHTFSAIVQTLQRMKIHFEVNIGFPILGQNDKGLISFFPLINTFCRTD